MEPRDPDGTELPRSRNTRLMRVIGVVLVVTLVVFAATFYWFLYLRALTPREVLEWDEWRAGMVRDVEGTITAVTVINTSYGPVRAVGLDQDLCADFTVVADPDEAVQVGQRYRKTLHFQEYSYNGLSGVWTPEFVCPFPLLWMSMHVLIDAVSFVMGDFMQFIGTDSAGWTTYEFFMPHGDRFPAHAIPAKLVKAPALGEVVGLPLSNAASWIVVGAMEYVRLSGGVEDAAIDSMPALSDGASSGGRMEFVDADLDGNLSDRDRLRVRMEPTQGEGHYWTYGISLGGGMQGTGSFGGVKAILQGPRGPFHWFLEHSGVPQIYHANDVGVGQNVTSVLAVGRSVGGAPAPLAEYSLSMRIAGGDPMEGPLRDAPVVFPTGTNVDFEDRGVPGVLDEGDRFAVTPLTAGSEVSFQLKTQNATSGDLVWFAGYGHVSGRIPTVIFSSQGLNPFTVTTNVTNWHPEMAFGRTLAVTLRENGTIVLDHIPLAPGTLGAWSGGSLSFADSDTDGFLSSSDAFAIQGTAGAQYELSVTLLFDRYEYSVTFGP